MKRQQSVWWDSARNRHIVYSVKTIQRLRDAGILTWNEVGPWRGISGLVRKYPTAKPIVVYPEFEPVYDNSQADVVFGSEDVIPKLVEQFEKHNAGLLANPRLLDELGKMKFIDKPVTDFIQLTRGHGALKPGTTGHDFCRGFFIVDESGDIVYTDEERYERVLEWLKQYEKDKE